MAEVQVSHRTADFDYDLPAELIAQYPTERRGDSRLLVVRRSDGRTAGRSEETNPAGGGVLTAGPSDRLTALEDLRFSDFPSLLSGGDVMVLNTTKVRHARLIGRRPSGAPVEVLLLHPASDHTWVAMGKPGSALHPGKRVELGEGIGIETIEILGEGYRRVRICGATADQAMARFGRLPLPPYIEREPTAQDEVRYQTVFAEREGSVAAPTAGLPFTPELLAALEARGARIARLELDVGPGTFKPIEVADYTGHAMHPEHYDIPQPTADLVNAARTRGAAVWAVGTTVVRALESAALPDGTIPAGPGETRLLIAPGYEFRVIDRLLTNFHLPRSTLLLLVAAFAGYETTLAAYRHAVRERYRFYSYGDAMAIR
ncbi:MAG: tRNA preQ1(34) S-adenosylmethionine ribosyltransferase-isomerase QueA [Gemmatimonadales bacterium]